MADFTTITKTSLDWKAPPPVETTGQAYEFQIGNGFFLEIGGGFRLTIQPANAAIQWSRTNKTINDHNWPASSVSSENFLDIGSGYDLLIGGGFKLKIGTGVGETSWTTISRSAAEY